MNMSPEKIIVLASSIALEIVKDKSVNEINEIKNILSLVASNLQTYSQQKLIFDANNKNNTTHLNK